MEKKFLFVSSPGSSLACNPSSVYEKLTQKGKCGLVQAHQLCARQVCHVICLGVSVKPGSQYVTSRNSLEAGSKPFPTVSRRRAPVCTSSLE